jgi:biopolymer transport protein ExbB/TolQ
MNAAKRFTIYALLPVIIFFLGMVVYKDAVGKILDDNPHPELIYGIFAFLAFGVILTFSIFYRYAVEQKRLAIFLEEKAIAANAPQDTQMVSRRSASAERLKRVAKVAGGRDAPIYPIFSLLSMATRRMTIQEGRGAVERELEVYNKRITSWLSMPQFLGGLLIGMGLVGTFIGLLSALDEIAIAISGLAGPGAAGGDSSGMFQILIARLQKPMQSMGIAFSASLFGLMGSIIIGFMMVAVKRCAQEVVAHLRVETYKAVGESFGWEDGGEDGQGSGMEAVSKANVAASVTQTDPKMLALMERFNEQLAHSMSNTTAFAGDMSQATKTLENAISDLANYVKQLKDSQVESERNRLVQRELALLDLSGRLDALVSTKQSSSLPS